MDNITNLRLLAGFETTVVRPHSHVAVPTALTWIVHLFMMRLNVMFHMPCRACHHHRRKPKYRFCGAPDVYKNSPAVCSLLFWRYVVNFRTRFFPHCFLVDEVTSLWHVTRNAHHIDSSRADVVDVRLCSDVDVKLWRFVFSQFYCLRQCFSKSVPRRGVRGS